MTFRNAVLVVMAAVLTLAATLTGGATTLNRTTYFTFNAPVRLHGVLLPAGVYVFEIANPDSGSNVTRVLDRKRSKVYVNGLTRVVIRPPSGRLDAAIIFGETVTSAPRRVDGWYPEGETTGREFLR
jgi:hypothetical protein